MRSRFFGTALRLTLVYFLLAGLWILFSDRLLAHWATGSEQLTRLQTYKGWGFVAVTGLGLYVLLSWRDRAEEQLRYQAGLLTDVSDAIISTDQQFGIVSWNRAAETMLGWSANEAIGKRVSEVTKMEYVDTEAEIVLAEFQAHGSWSGEVIQRRKDGTSIYAQSSVTAIFDKAGNTIGAVAVNRDITQRKRAEQALHESEERYRVLVEQSPDMIGVMDEQGLVYVNQSGVRLLGAEQLEQLLGKNAEDLVHPEDRGAIRARMRRIAEKGAPNPRVEFRLIRLDGTAVQVESVSMPIVYQGKPVTQFIARDITQRKQAEDALRESEEKFKKAFYTSPDSININRLADGMYVSINNGFTRIMGYSEADVIGKTSVEMDIWDNPEDRRALVAGLKKDGEVRDLEARFRARNGKIIDGLMSAAVIDLNGTPHIISMTRDITQRRQAEQALLKSRNNYQRLFDRANDVILIFEPEQEIILEANAAACAAYGFDHDELVGMSLRALTKNVGAGAAHIKDFLEGRPQDNFESIHVNKAGQDIYFLINCSLITYDGREAILSINRDVTERKGAEQALRDRETRYKALFEDSPVSLWEEDFSAVKRRLDALRQDGITNLEEYFAAHPEVVSECVALVKVLDVNKETMALQRANRKEDLLKGLVERLEGTPLQYFQDELVRIAAGETSFHWNGLNRTPDGRLIDVSVNWSAAPGYEESLARVMVSMLDITERKRAEEALRQSKERFQRYFELGLIGMAITSPTKGILEVNDQLCAILGYGRDELLGMTWAEITHPDDLDADVDQFNRVAAGEIDGYFLEKRWIRKDGRVIDSSMSVRCVRFVDGSIDYFVALVQDVTERKRAEAERQALAEIMQAAALLSNLQGFLGVMRESLARVVYAENFFVIFHNPDSGLFEEVFSVDKYDEPMPPSSLEKSITSYVFRTGEPLLLTDEKFAELMASGQVELVGKDAASWLGAPLKTPAGTIGVIAVQNYEDPNCYSERDKVFLASVGAQVALAIERKQAEEKLEEERILLRTLIDSLPDRVYVMDQQGRTIISNTADWQAAGAKAMEEVIGKTDLETYPPELAVQYWAVDQTVISSGTAVLNHEERGTDPSGNPTWLLTSKVPLRDAQGKVRGLVGIGRDITAHKSAEARIERQVHRLSALRAIDAAISSSFDLRLSLNILLAQSINELGVDAGAVLVLNKFSNELEYAAGVGFRGGGITGLNLKLGEGLAGQAILQRRTVSVPNLAEVAQPFSRPRLMSLMAEEEFAAFFIVPLLAKGEVKGVMEVFHRARLDPEPEWLDFLETLAGQAAIAIDSAQTFSELQHSNLDLALAYDATIEGWSRAMDLRDKETEGHTQRVTESAVKLGRAMGLPEPELTQVRRGSLLHDIGKMGVPDMVLLKPGPLTEEEWVIMRRHPTFAYEMLSPIRYLQPAISIPYCHHEKWDGTGYPRGLKGEQIPLAARMFAVVDVFDALTSDRPYRTAWSTEKAREYLREQAGIHFDPQIVELFLKEAAEGE